ncbi:hypothetical protein LNQ49_20115 [Flavobacterium sp. F-65]|uniref:NUMOD3 motif-containing protein n=1 Tax=Flavobacterium pisciphilum TaxID=2893755 RepID=A0ABS8MYR1_9FLAO|nr:hypothetical protein [Flavobacterium sp. F-65]MCC9073893.1 hypothetical protein [Flavobacterium sp. F-65]
MKKRVSSTKHVEAQNLLNKPGTKVQYINVDFGTATSASDKNNILRHYENREAQKEIKKGQKLNNNTGIQDSKKRKAVEDLIDLEGAKANKRRITCK